MYDLARDALFLIPPEASHRVALSALAAAERVGLSQRLVDCVYQPVTTMGLKFRNRVGLAAGLDKNARCVAGLMALGFGSVEVGTVTPRPQPGNAAPRLFRLREQRALINRMGFNNDGAEAVYRRLVRVRDRLPLAGIVGVNIGKNKDTPLEQAAEDYLACLARLHAVADYLTVNVSSPNTPGLRSLQGTTEMRDLLARIRAKAVDLDAAAARRVPVLVKLAPDLEADELAEIADVLCEVGVDGVIATNTTVSRPFQDLARVAHADETGGLSGVPLRPLALRAVSALAQALRDRLPIIGVGGVDDVESGAALVAAGATLVQVYTGFIYRGPALVHELACALG
jgi:dihydroorotate dehydrogenase